MDSHSTNDIYSLLITNANVIYSTFASTGPLFSPQHDLVQNIFLQSRDFPYNISLREILVLKTCQKKM